MLLVVARIVLMDPDGLLRGSEPEIDSTVVNTSPRLCKASDSKATLPDRIVM